jgi:thioredoxin reductase (NADPH)
VEGRNIYCHSLVLATGASANRLHLPGEDTYWSRGISACAICDGATPQFRNAELAVVGGGDSACEEAVYLTKYGSQVHLIVRRESLRASKAMADRVLANPRISVHWNRQVGGYGGSNWLEELQLNDGDGQPAERLRVRGLFYAIGHTPNTRLMQGQLELDGQGYLITKPGSAETSAPGVFAAGDVADSQWRQAITAAASGCQAALAAERWLSHHDLAVTVERQQVEPAAAQVPVPTERVSENEYQPTALWQGGGYALRRLYHESDRPLLVVYTSPSCGPCHVFKPQLKRVLQELAGQAQGVEINLEEDPEIASQAGVTGTPTVQLFLNKELRKQWRGVQQRSVVKTAIEQLLPVGV